MCSSQWDSMLSAVHNTAALCYYLLTYFSNFRKFNYMRILHQTHALNWNHCFIIDKICISIQHEEMCKVSLARSNKHLLHSMNLIEISFDLHFKYYINAPSMRFWPFFLQWSLHATFLHVVKWKASVSIFGNRVFSSMR